MASRAFDVLVIGAGHAGCEAALAAARMGCSVALITLDTAAMARMSCNPAIGGLAKGHLVREIDALGGEMGRAIDATGIQFRLLNTSRGPAVQAPRAQADREAYERRMRRVVLGEERLTLLRGEAVDLAVEGNRVEGVVLGDGRCVRATCVVVTSGTFLRGRIHVGRACRSGGRIDEGPADKLSAALQRLGLPLGRLKTGTPPRILKDTVDFDRMARQPGDPVPVPFSFETEAIDSPQVDCHITFTNRKSHAIIRANLATSPIYSGVIRSRGPRYCPSIEDKVVRFADRQRHQIFVEPEGLDHPWVYLNGLSTSLPAEVQAALVRSIEGLECAEIARPGYAVEYDFVQPTCCAHTLEVQTIRGLYLAGQINGTTGYEEAAALGLLAGMNAALSVQKREPVVLSRGEAYIGVLVDDLVLKGTTEPYRMFTSRAEYRLLLEIDSADLRLTHRGREAGLISDARYERFLEREARITEYAEYMRTRTLMPTPAAVDRGKSVLGITLAEPTTPALLMRRGDVSMEALEELLSEDLPVRLQEGERRFVANRLRYGGYIERQMRDLRRLGKDEARAIPPRFDFASVSGLSNEVVEKLGRARPTSLAQAGRVSGVTPAALSLINIYLEKLRRTGVTSGMRPKRRRRRTGTPHIGEPETRPAPDGRPGLQ